MASNNNSTKSKLYFESLDLIRRLNYFNKLNPLNLNGTINITASDTSGGGGGGMNWNEVIRKFNKHVKGKELTSAAALTEHTLHQLLLKSSTTNSFNSSSSYSPTSTSFPPTIFPPTILSSDIPIAQTSITTLESLITTSASSTTVVEVDSAKIVIAFGYYSIGMFEKCLNLLDQINSLKEEGLLSNVGIGESYHYTLRVLSSALKGYSKQHLNVSIPEIIQSYTKTAQLYIQTCTLLSKTIDGNKKDISLHLIGEDILFRLCFFLVQSSDPSSSIPYHATYLTLPSPPPHKSIQILSSYRTLLLSTTSTSSINSSTTNNEFKKINKLQEGLVRNLTSLPRAGEVNSLYLQFLDGVMLTWVKGGEKKEECSEIIEIMYRALTHTFQSQRLLRYLITLLVIQGTTSSYLEAGKTVKLYVELWNNTRITDAKKVVQDLRKFRNFNSDTSISTDNNVGITEVTEAEKKRLSNDLKSLPGTEKEEEDFDIDSEVQFITTLIFSIRLYCKYLNNPKFALELANRAKEIWIQGRKDLSIHEDKILESRIERSLGIAFSHLTHKESNKETRSTQQLLSLSHLEKAVTLDPTSYVTLYQYTYQLAITRQISLALECARKLIELEFSLKGKGKGKEEGKGREGWHLLGLLVAAKKDLGASLGVLELALDDEEDDDESEELAETKETQEEIIKNQIEGSKYEYKKNEMEGFEVEIGIRMTKNIIIEAMEGSEAALMDQTSLLAYFSETFDGIKEIVDSPKVSIVVPEVSTSNGHNNKSTASISKRLSIHRGLAEQDKSQNVSTSKLSTRTFTSPSERSLISLEELPSSTTTIIGPGPTNEINPRATKLLIQLWLMSAASFRRIGKLDECRGAIQEAEGLNGDDPEIWVQFALYWIANSDLEQARTSLLKSLSFSIEYPPAIILLSRLYLNSNSIPSKLPFAEGMLISLIENQGWDIPEAWFELSRCFKLTGRVEKEKECLIMALKLENSRSVREFNVVPSLL